MLGNTTNIGIVIVRDHADAHNQVLAVDGLSVVCLEPGIKNLNRTD